MSAYIKNVKKDFLSQLENIIHVTAHTIAAFIYRSGFQAAELRGGERTHAQKDLLSGFIYSFKIIILAQQILLELLVFPNKLPFFYGVFHTNQKLVHVNRLVKIIIGTVPHGVHGSFHISVAGENNNANIRVQFSKSLENLCAIHSRHAHIGEHHIKIALTLEHIYAFPATCGAYHLISLKIEDKFQVFQNGNLVID